MGKIMKRYTAPHVLAQEFSMDFADLQDYRYKYGRTDRPIYSIGDKYYCAVKKGQKPAKMHSDEHRFEWLEKPSKFADSIGWIIYVST